MSKKKIINEASFNIKITMDGDQYCAVIRDCFTNLQEDSAGFSESVPDAIIKLMNELKDNDSSLIKWEKKELWKLDY